MMEQIRFELVLRATTPLAHHAEVFGNNAIFQRRKMFRVDGTEIAIPEITGATMRNRLRTAASLTLLDAAGLLDSARLTEAALRLLFAGGMITGKGDASTVKLDEYRTLVELLPHIGIFGGCAGNRSIPGKLQVEPATLICGEYLDELPGWVRAWLAETGQTPLSRRAYIEEVQRVRMDPSLDPAKRLLLTDAERSRIEGRLLASETASAEGDAVGREREKSTMMPRRFETAKQGSLWFWRVQVTVHSDLERATFLLALLVALYDLRVGGKQNEGMGRLEVVIAKRGTLARPVERLRKAAPEEPATAIVPIAPPACGDELALTEAQRGGLADVFLGHVESRRERLTDFLAAVDA